LLRYVTPRTLLLRSSILADARVKADNIRRLHMALELIFESEKDTPGTRKFAEVKPEDGSRPPVGSLYVTKDALAKIGNPQKIKVTIEAG
jgi:hypothetical protein